MIAVRSSPFCSSMLPQVSPLRVCLRISLRRLCLPLCPLRLLLLRLQPLLHHHSSLWSHQLLQRNLAEAMGRLSVRNEFLMGCSEFDFGRIPQHVLLHIFSYLDVQSLRKVNQANKQLHASAHRANFIATCLARTRAAVRNTTVLSSDLIFEDHASANNHRSTRQVPNLQASSQMVDRHPSADTVAYVARLVTSQQVSEFWDIFTAQVPKPGASAGATTGLRTFSAVP